MGQYCIARWRLSSSVTLSAGGPAAGAVRGGARAFSGPTLHGEPVVLRLALRWTQGSS